MTGRPMDHERAVDEELDVEGHGMRPRFDESDEDDTEGHGMVRQ